MAASRDPGPTKIRSVMLDSGHWDSNFLQCGCGSKWKTINGTTDVNV